MKFSFYQYVSVLKSCIITRIENTTKKKNWLLYTMFYCSLISLFFAFPSFEKWDVSSGRLSSFLLQCEGITEFWNENKISNINYRLTVPIFVGLMGGGHITSIIIRYTIGILLFGLCGKIIYNYTKDRTSAFLFSMTLALTNPGVTSFCEYRGIFDGIALFLIIIPFYIKNNYIITLTTLLAFFTDERTLICAGFLFTYGIFNARKEFDLRYKIFNNLNIPIISAIILYMFIRYQINVTYGLELAEYSQYDERGWKLLNQINNVPAAIWTGLEGFWIIVALNLILLFKHKNFLPGLAFLITIISLIVLGNSVIDTSRSMLYLFPAVIISMEQISKNTPNNEIRNILILCFIISFIFPSYWVGGKSSIWWQYPMPIQLIRWFFIL
ncbi:MAG: hypothetical protein CMG07_00815 [Candidatus Marinimicrobia bacterium]|nr:hypothetical protein [Candidatus Neomarinimicrobiota bacterium]